MKQNYCDNTDCETPDKKQELCWVRLTKEFGKGECFWCDKCRERDNEMIKDEEGWSCWHCGFEGTKLEVEDHKCQKDDNKRR